MPAVVGDRFAGEEAIGVVYTDRALSYDQMGRVTAQWDCLPSSGGCSWAETTETRNYLGSPTSITDPAGRTINYSYNAGNRPITAADSSTTYATSVHYSASGALCAAVFGGAVTEAATFNSRLQPIELQATTGVVSVSTCTGLGQTGNLLDLSFNFNLGSGDNGNVMGVTNNRDATRSQAFTYDALNRILTATASTYATSPTHCWGESYVFDNNTSGGAWGNLTNINVASTAYNGCTQEALSQSVTSSNQFSGFCYDAAGNLLAESACGNPTYNYNAKNQLTSTAGVSYTYDPTGSRVEKSSGTLYWYGPDNNVLEETNLSFVLISEYVFLGGQRIARRDSSGDVFYYFADHLGTSRVLAEIPSGQTTATLCYDADFYPFGGERAYTNTCAQNYKFAGKERDSESGLDNFLARYNSSSMGRFMSPDPLGGKRVDPQTLNKYSYVRNNPLTFTDPTGLYTCADDQNKCQTVADKAFEAARQNDLQSKDKDVLRAANAYGDPTKDNGVNVGFADLSKSGEGGKTVSTLGADDSGNLRANSNVTIDSKVSGSALDAAVGHEGSHVADAQDVVKSIQLNNDAAGSFKIGADITRYSSEQRAYGVTNSILNMDNEKEQFNCGMLSTCTLGPGTIPGQISGIVDKILANSPNYISNGKPLSPSNQGGSVVSGLVVPH